jgi:hypothetical protein
MKEQETNDRHVARTGRHLQPAPKYPAKIPFIPENLRAGFP